MDVNNVTREDVAYSFVKGAIGSVPIPGAALFSELFGIIITPPLEKRRNEWMQDISERLKQLEESGCDLSSLSSNDKFVDIALQASTLALKTSQKEKINAFKNVITNAAIGQAPDEAKSQIFLSFLADFTVLHLNILHLFDDPIEWFRIRNIQPPNVIMGTMLTVLTSAFPELGSEKELIEFIWNDLEQAGLHNVGGSLQTMMSGEGTLSRRTTNLGREFIAFISAPNI